MKPRNFPARKLARQLAAKGRADRSSCIPTSARGVFETRIDFADSWIGQARAVRTKKRRAS